MKVFLDTNVLLDWMLKDRPCNREATIIVSTAEEHLFELLVSTQSIIDAAFSSRKAGLKQEKFIQSINYLRTFCKIVGIDWIDMSWAIENPTGDFEDDMQYASAYNNVCDYFITRDKALQKLNDKFCPMTVITPEDFVAAMKAD